MIYPCAKRKISLVDTFLHFGRDAVRGLVFGSNNQRDRLKSHFPVDILGNALQPPDAVKNLGVWLDSDLSLSKHVQSICRSCFVQLIGGFH